VHNVTLLERYRYTNLLSIEMPQSKSSRALLSYLDECQVRECGRSKRGVKLFVPCRGRKFKRTNVISAILNNKIVGEVYDCKTDSHWFES
jgi:hypothetical protein